MKTIEELDKKIQKNDTELQKHNNSNFFERNKKLIVGIGVILLVLWLGSLLYTYYWIPKLQTMFVN